MHDEVRIATDRRREVRVVLGREAEVTERLGGVACLLHRAEEDRVHEALLGRPATCRRTSAKSAGTRTVAVATETDAESLEEARELLDGIRRRRLVHAMEEPELPARQLARDGLVRGEHELLDHLVRDRALGTHDLLRPAAQVEDDLRLGEVEVDRAALPTSRHEEARQRLRAFERRHERGARGADVPIAVDQGPAHLRVRQAGALRMTASWNVAPVVRPRASKSIRTALARRSSSGLRLQMPFESSSGSIGSTRSGK
jgi:hypothetical protein